MDYTMTNIVVELFAAAILLVILVYELASPYRQMPLNRLFSIALCMGVIALTSDAVAWMIDGMQGAVAHLLVWFFNLMIYSCGVIASIVLLIYLVTRIGVPGRMRRIFLGAAMFLGIVYHGILFLSMFNGMIFTVDESNVFRLGSHYRISMYVACLIFLEIVVLALLFRKKIGGSETIAFLTYGLIPCTGLIINLFYNEIMFLHISLVFSLCIVFINVQLEQEKRLKEKEVELIENNTALTLSQIRSHFLYNSLTTIKQLCGVNPEEAKVAIEEFSDYLRANLDSLVLKRCIPFDEEIRHVQSYLHLEKRKLADKLTIVYDFCDRDFTVPPLSIQPIVENAVQRGISRKGCGGTLKIATYQDQHNWYIRVIDDGVGFAASDIVDCRHSHIGIKNVKQRLDVMCNGTLEISSIPGAGTSAVIKIPKVNCSTRISDQDIR